MRLDQLGRNRDEVDEILDEVFGQPDERGPSAADAVLLAGGGAAIVAGQVADLPGAVTVIGACAVAFGAILPIRSLWRRSAARRRAARVRAAIGDGTIVRTSNPVVQRLIAAHDRVVEQSATLAHVPSRRVADVAHAAMLEVATLLGGRSPVVPEEVGYVVARVDALDALAATITDPRVGDGEPDQRRALVEARQEIDHLAGTSSLISAAALQRDLLGSDDG